MAKIPDKLVTTKDIDGVENGICGRTSRGRGIREGRTFVVLFVSVDKRSLNKHNYEHHKYGNFSNRSLPLAPYSPPLYLIVSAALCCINLSLFILGN
jgi:hypothetical protein